MKWILSKWINNIFNHLFDIVSFKVEKIKKERLGLSSSHLKVHNLEWIAEKILFFSVCESNSKTKILSTTGN